MGQWQQDFEDTAFLFSVVTCIALFAFLSLVQLSMFDDMICFKRISSMQFAFAIGASPAKQL